MSLHLAYLIYDGNISLSYIAIEVETHTVDKTEHSEYIDCYHNIRALIDGDSETKFTRYFYW